MEWLKSICSLVLQLFKIDKMVDTSSKYTKRDITDIEDKFYGR